MSRPTFRRLLLALAGIGLGGLFLWLAVRDVDGPALRAALAGLTWPALILPLALYWVGMTLRVARWAMLLAPLQRVAPSVLAEVLLVGYAVNNVLPARLGELFRADYAKRRCGLGRTVALGSIIVERLFDLSAIVACLALGLGAAVAAGPFEQRGALALLLLNAALISAAAFAAIRCLVATDPARLPLPRCVQPAVVELRRGLAAVTRRRASAAAALTVAVWCGEVGALWAVFRALGVALDPPQAMLIMSAASLSTLIPTAPGYLGTYQLVFAWSLTMLGGSSTLGVLASTIIQVVLFGSVTAVGLLLYLARSIHNVRMTQPHAPTPS